MKDLEKQYGYLWDGEDKGWVLLRAPELLGGYCVVNKIRMVLLHVDDSELNLQLCERMREAGCEVLEDLPKAGAAHVKRG